MDIDQETKANSRTSLFGNKYIYSMVIFVVLQVTDHEPLGATRPGKGLIGVEV
jgi:hypothetical protein